MQGIYGNIYQAARKAAGLTQEQAAERLNVSVRSLADYETDKTIPKDDIVCAMIEVYEAKRLGYQHLKTTQVGKMCLPDLDATDLAKSVLRLQKEIGDVDSLNGDIVEIACDGAVGTDEQPRWKSITKEIYEMAGAALAVIFSG